MQALKVEGHEVLVCTFGSKDQPELLDTTVGGIRVVAPRFDDETRKTAFDGPRMFNTFSWQASRARLLAQKCGPIIDEFKPDILESQEFNALGFFLAAQRKYPFVVRCYGPMAHLMRGAFTGTYPIADTELVDAMELAPLAMADGVIAICHDIAERLSKLANRPLSDWDVIRGPFVVSDSQVLQQRPEHPTILFWGRVDKLKGADLLMDAFIELSGRHPTLQLTIAGPETVEEGETKPYADTMRAKLNELGLSDRVRFLGYTPREQLRGYAATSTVCVFPSRYETCCYAALEAIDYGGVVVAAKAGGLPDYHEHGTSAWLVERDDVASLTQGIEKVLTEPALRQHLLDNARGYIKKACDPQSIARASVESYHKAIARFQQRQDTERAFSVFAEHFMQALDDEPLWAQYHPQSTPPPPQQPSVKHAIKRLLRIENR